MTTEDAKSPNPMVGGRRKWNLIVDVANCTNCNLCTLANQDEHVGNDFAGYSAPMPRHGHRWIDIKSPERGSGPVMDVEYLPVMCQPCDDAPCMKAAKNGAVTKRPDGIVHIDPVKAKGQKAIAEACPYGAVRWNEELQLPQHWFFDAHLIDRGWKEPRCTQVCATGALKAIKVTDEEMAAIKSREGLRDLRPESYPPGAVIVRQGDEADALYIITKGEVEVFLRHPDGAEVVVNRHKRGEYFGEIALLRGGTRRATVRAGPDGADCMALDRPTFEELMRASEPAQQEFLREIDARLAAG